MLENIAIWGGIAGVIVAVFAVIILFLTRQSIIHILDKDAILFDQNFEIKQKAVSSAMALVDELAESAGTIKVMPDFAKKAKQAYNELLCVLSDVRVADEFYNIAINLNTTYNESRIDLFKIICRKDIGLKVNINQRAKQILAQQKQNSQPAQPNQFATQPVQNPVQSQYAQIPVQPVQPSVVANQPVQETPVQYVQAPAQTPTQTVQPQQQMQRVAQPQVRPTQPRTAVPVRPTQTQPIKRVQPVKKEDKPNN